MEPRESIFGMSSAAEAFARFQAAMELAVHAFYPLPRPEFLPYQLTCKLCGGQYRMRDMDFDIDRICPDCREKAERIAERAGGVFTVGDLVSIVERLGKNHTAIRYGRPWQDHVPARSRHLIRDDT